MEEGKVPRESIRLPSIEPKGASPASSASAARESVRWRCVRSWSFGLDILGFEMLGTVELCLFFYIDGFIAKDCFVSLYFIFIFTFRNVALRLGDI